MFYAISLTNKTKGYRHYPGAVTIKNILFKGRKMKKTYAVLMAFIAVVVLFGTIGCGKKVEEAIGKDEYKRQEKKAREFQMFSLSQSVDVGKSSINYYDKSAVDTSEFEMAEDDKPFTIVDYGPVDELPYEVTHPTIYVMFSHPVVPLAKLGDPVTSSNIMKITPEVKGIYRWYGTKLLSFEPVGKYPPQHEYTVEIDAGITSLGGKML